MIEKNFEQEHKEKRLKEFENAYAQIFNEHGIPQEPFYDLIKLQDILEKLKLNLLEVGVYKEEPYPNQK